MDEQEKQEGAEIKHKDLRKFLLRDNENLLSFLCGIFSNIPISLLFTVNTYGKDCYAHAYFFVWIGAFIYSIIVTVCAFAVTLKKIDVKKELNKDTSVAKKEDELDKKLKDKAIKRYFRLRFCIFAVFFVLLVCSAIALWVLSNFAQY